MAYNTIDALNECNAMAAEGNKSLPPITYDGLHCPTCSDFTVTCAGKSWCPSLSCDWGVPIQYTPMITKWCTD